MTTLDKAPFAALLDKLFAESDANSPWTNPVFTELSDEDKEKAMRSKTAYKEFYSHLKEYALPVSRDTGTLLYMLARSTAARNIIEFGTSFGISTLHLAAALKDNGGGKIITSEFEPSKVVRARENLTTGGLIDFVELREGDALETLKTDLPTPIDLVLLDGAKSLYPEILGLLEPHFKTGTLVIADNADYSPEYLERVRSKDSGYMSIPFDGEVEVSMRL
jgi:predicted O-methyltransferase YrrM